MPLALNGYEFGLLASALTFISFALVVALVVPRWRPEFPGKYLGWFITGAIVLFLCQFTAVLLLANLGENESEAAPSPTQTETTPPAQGDPVAGKQIFMSQPCGSCHTLADAGTSGNVGPNLDQAMPPFALVVQRVTNGKSPMPSFKGTLSPQQIDDVAAYVSSVAGK